MNPLDNIWQVALALVLIVGVVLALGYLAKRFQLAKPGGGGALRIVDSTYLGPKERLVLVQVGEQHVLVGMNPQCISKLAEFQAGESFAMTLERVTEKSA